MRNILLTVQYDGTEFCGWQYQPNQRSVQGVLQGAVEGMVREKVILYGSSRTDSGVHARGLPVNFETSRAIELHSFIKGLNSTLPVDVGVVDAQERPMGWRSRFASVAKTYVYRFQIGFARWPLVTRGAWHVRRRSVDVAAMNDAGEALLGLHDFSAFRSSRCVSTSSIRHMHEVRVEALDDMPIVQLTVVGNAFLHNMVRIIAGTLLAVGLGRRTRADLERGLATGDRLALGTTAPACGLTLYQVHFDGYPRLGKKPMNPVDALPTPR